jgi:hypothetical protein
MTKYYYSDGSNNYGPFTLEELAEREITKITSVWIHDESKHDTADADQDNVDNKKANSTETVTVEEIPKSWMTESILVTVLCCPPLGILAMLNASKVESLFNMGDIDGAKRHSEGAKKRVIESVIIGIALYILFFVAFYFKKGG